MVHRREGFSASSRLYVYRGRCRPESGRLRRDKELSDQSYVPTLVAGEEVLANFDVDQLEKFLGEHQIEP